MPRGRKRKDAAEYETPADAAGVATAPEDRPWPGDEPEMKDPSVGGGGDGSPERKPALTFDPNGSWPPEVCARIRKLNQRINAMISKRKNRFSDRDALRDEIKEMGPERSSEMLNKCADLVEILFQIDALDKGIKSATGKLREAVDNADQGRLFDEEEDEPSDQLTLANA